MTASPTLLERDAELELLTNLLEAAPASGGKVVLIRGEAGIGKTALVKAFIENVQGRAHVLLGTCDDLLTPRPLGPFWDMAREEPSLEQVLEIQDRSRVLDAALDLLSRRIRPTVMVIEDTQWAAEATLDVIKYAGRRIEQTNGLLVLTYREGEVDYEHPLRAVIGELSPTNLVRIHLEPLSAEAVSVMAAGKDVDLDRILDLTDGNPLFVTEMLASDSEEVPASVRDSVLARAAKLSPRARELLELVSVIPGETEREIVDAVLGPSTHELAEGIRQGLLVNGGATVAFKNELSRRAVESALNSAQRRRLNGVVLERLAADPDSIDTARLVHHARVAGDVATIVEYAPKAARDAMAVEGYREAVAHFETLEPYLDQIEPTELAAILDDWAHSELYLDRIRDPLNRLGMLIDLHRASGDQASLARVLTLAVRLHQFSARQTDAQECLSEARSIVESLPPGSELGLVVAQEAWLAMMRNQNRQAWDAAERAIRIARETGRESVLISALNTKGVIALRWGNRCGVGMLEEASWRAADEGDTFEQTRALNNLANRALRLRDLRLADSVIERMEDQKKLPYVERSVQELRAEIRLRQGKWHGAEDIALTGLAGVVAGETAFQPWFHWVLGALAIRRGDPDGRAKLQDLSPHHFGPGYSTLRACLISEWMWLNGELDPDRVVEFTPLVGESLRQGNAWDSGELALWLWKLGELDVLPEGVAEPYRLIVQGEWQAAAEIFEERGIPYERAIALSHGDTEARLQALEILDGLGATAVSDKMRQELRDKGVSVPKRVRGSGQARLTARQVEVLGLLAEGLSNIEIAERLFLSPRTVEHHVAAVIGKLNASTRKEAVINATEHGLVAST